MRKKPCPISQLSPKFSLSQHLRERKGSVYRCRSVGGNDPPLPPRHTPLAAKSRILNADLTAGALVCIVHCTWNIILPVCPRFAMLPIPLKMWDGERGEVGGGREIVPIPPPPNKLGEEIGIEKGTGNPGSPS